MLIDWFTVAAQALNFLILVGLLRYFLYQPILDAIDQREKRIATELADADAQKTEAQQERESFEAKNAKFDREHADKLKQVNTEVQQERLKLMEEARTAATALLDKHQKALKSQQAHLYPALQRKAAQEVFAIARQALDDLADAPLEAQMVAVFLRRLKALSNTETEALRTAFKGETVRVRTRFALSDSLTAEVRKSLLSALGPASELSFETADQLNGIELSTQGQKLAWSISDYLTSLQESLSQLLKTQDTPADPASTETDLAKTVSSESEGAKDHA